MIKKRRGSAKAAIGQQQAEIRRSARGKRFVGDDTGAAEGRAAERAKVLRLQVAAREAALHAAHEQEAERMAAERAERPLWEALGGLALSSARLAASVARLPFRLARIPLRAAALPFRVAASLVPRPGAA
jgi:hypothetical protein